MSADTASPAEPSRTQWAKRAVMAAIAVGIVVPLVVLLVYEDPPPPRLLPISDVQVSNAVSVIPGVREVKDPDILTIYFDVEAEDMGPWQVECSYSLLDEAGEVVKRGRFPLAGSGGTYRNLSAPFTFDRRTLSSPPVEATVTCPL